MVRTSNIILLGIGDKNFAIDIPNAERRVTCRKIWIDKAAHGYPVEIFVKYVHSAAMKVGGVKKIMAIGHAYSQTLIDIILTASNSYNGVGLVQSRVPAGDCSIFTDENEKGGRRVSIFRYLEEGSTIKYNTRGIGSLAGMFRWNRYEQRNRCAILMVRVETPVPLSLTQIVPDDEAAMPQGLTRFGSVCGATPGISDWKFVFE